MRPATVFYPDAIALVLESDIQAGTIDALNEIISTGFSDFSLGEEALQFTEGFESHENKKMTAMGRVPIESHITDRNAEVMITLDSFTHQFQAIRKGLNPSTDVSTAQTASFTAANDATAVEGVAITESVYQPEFSLLARLPGRGTQPATYLYVPKLTIKGDDQQYSMRLKSELKPAMKFTCLGLHSDELAVHQALYSGVVEGGLAYLFTGKTDV